MLETSGQVFSSIGEVVKVYTLVDFYNYIKAVEYLICIFFFGVFPIFYRSVMRPPTGAKKG